MCKIAFLLLFSLSAFASPGKISSSINSTKSAGSIDPNNLSSDQGGSTLSTRLQMVSPTLYQNWTVQGGVSNSKTDYSNFILRKKDGTLEPLNFHEPETDVSAGVIYQNGNHTAQLLGSQTVSTSPFAAKSLTSSYSVGFLNKSTIVGLEYSVSHKDQPLSYYIDREFHTAQRPSGITSSKITSFYEQIFTERFKGRLSLARGERYQDRPQNFGIEARAGYALTSRVIAKGEAGIVEEDKSQGLKNERGYFDLKWAAANLSLEPQYDFFIVPSYGVTLERESQPDSGRVIQVATDTYKVDLKYDPGNWSAGINIAFQNANTGYQTQVFKGELSWNL